MVVTTPPNNVANQTNINLHQLMQFRQPIKITIQPASFEKLKPIRHAYTISCMAGCSLCSVLYPGPVDPSEPIASIMTHARQKNTKRLYPSLFSTVRPKITLQTRPIRSFFKKPILSSKEARGLVEARSGKESRRRALRPRSPAVTWREGGAAPRRRPWPRRPW
jgi:hypothetical protein